MAAMWMPSKSTHNLKLLLKAPATDIRRGFLFSRRRGRIRFYNSGERNMPKGSLPRRKALRLPDFDYRTPGGYFITACTWKRSLLFNEVEEKHAIQRSWEELLDIFGGIELDESVVMYNHFHGILWIIDDGAYRLHPGWRSIQI
jgi:hypothetical protein